MAQQSESDKKMLARALKAEVAENAELNRRILNGLKTLLKELILPSLDDETLVNFGRISKHAPKIVEDFIGSRGIGLQSEFSEHNPPAITLYLSMGSEDSHILSMNGSLESGLLCAMRFKNLKDTGRDDSLIHVTEEMDSITLPKIIQFCELNDADAKEIWIVDNLENANTERLVEIIKGAEELKIESLLLKSVHYMKDRMKGKTPHQLRWIFGFRYENSDVAPGYAYDGDYDADEAAEERYLESIKSMRHFFDLLIPSLDDSTYLCFASLNMSCAKLVNHVHSRPCFVPGILEGQSFSEEDFMYPFDTISISCGDGIIITATKDLVRFSGLIKSSQLDHRMGYTTMDIELPSTNSVILQGIIDYCSEHGNSDRSGASSNGFDSAFLRRFNLWVLAKAAHKLKIQSLVEVVSKAILGRLNGKTVDQIGRALNMRNESTESKEDQQPEDPTRELITIEDLLAPLAPGEDKDKLVKSLKASGYLETTKEYLSGEDAETEEASVEEEKVVPMEVEK